ncbi:aminotransferase class V-fold PLP-dependent enzyme [Sulfurisphaera ohwakuensis]|uniref:Aminotransferase class V-fold PLP-dependent enzyme n=1 Tax=Sulfurisphaera ohwakuensis TaxID=69656 RepID=A0A650CIX2_SULOH|nr:aminotransferase class V-fold PLP-dependent enzyme [Sulfurisphaera ohwakuensis]MBB5253459.1 selenocysteine lyase/cysteine desulfurase [Sulfurisphaera ohwakuensis]QGR17770.1 aminotransferase class V-fold PLP-dependent enzyme [Sulfurisphaera ohwakuensis]
MKFHEDFRNLVPVTKEYVYLNHAAISPIPLPILYESLRYLLDISRYGSLPVNDEENDDFYHLREKVGKLINAEPDTISFIPNTSFGINIIAHGLDLNEGDEIVTDSLEFPAVTYPFFKLKKKNIKIVIVKPRLENFEDDLLSSISKKTRLIAISHVSFNTGVKLDIKKISKEAKSVGAYTLVDIIQSAGATEVNVKDFDIDFAVAGGYKWLMGPQGSGFMYVKKGLIEDPPFYGWRSSSNYLDFNSENFMLEKGPRRFEIGTIDVAANIALAKSCEIVSQHKDEIYSRIQNLTDFVIKYAEEQGLEVITPKNKKAGIVIIKTNNPKELSRRLLEKKIVVSPRGNGVRISTHFYNLEDEVKIAIDEIRKLAF